ncbi:hypothetical protein CPIN17260_1069 [Campylobacter pinnipediorum subsp. pinnipediorum]|uniref:hypothetical protein n=1 Tax=Campylobacter pinnipediorum TaxID=1965231 RepID=UPI00099521CC|nr:hypothetical protein [Campylobacter pinnipediorum]AQW81358.1 hypothetical protein CPIN17260_1069 [Campylobacter pinnipediorum subsp. pinnipediorum]
MTNTNYNEVYKERLKDLLELSTKKDSPYSETIKFLEEKFNEYNITNDYRIKILIALLPQMTLQFTQTAMQVALQLADEDLSFAVKLENLKKQGSAMDANIEGIKEQTKNQEIKNAKLSEQRADELENLKKQGRMLEAQIKKLEKENKLAQSQQEAIDRQVKDNRVIKVLSVLGSFIEGNQQGGMIVPSDMTKFFFDLQSELIKNDVSITKPTEMKMTERKK